MMIKTLDNVYINMEDFSGFTIGYPNDSDFTVTRMRHLRRENRWLDIDLKSIQTATNVKDVVRKTGDPEQ